MFDTHVHLDLLADGPAELQAAVDVGVTRVLGIGLDPRRPAPLRGALPAGLAVVRAVGLHPQEVTTADDVDAALAALAATLTDRAPDVVAVGECGLDARPGIGNAALHAQAFRGQLALARRHGLPVVLHGVRRDGAMLAALDDEAAAAAATTTSGVWHGFSGAKETMQAAVKRGLHIAVGFVVLNDNARRLQEAVPLIPDDRLLVETDAPPLPPARLVDVVAAVARLRGTSAADIAALTERNARRLFGG